MQSVTRLFVFMLVLVVALPAVAQTRLVRKSVAVEILPASPSDSEVVGQIKRIVVNTLEDYRNLSTRRYLSDKDVKAAEELAQAVNDGNNKVQVGKRNTTFDAGVDTLNKAYLKAKGLMGELDAPLVARLYRGMALAQVVQGDSALALQYLTVLLNLEPGTTRRSLQYTEEFTKAFDQATERLKAGGKTSVVVRCSVPEARIFVDGQQTKGNPATLSLTVGGHLVQAEADGYYRAGWIKDATLSGEEWEIALHPIESRARYLATIEQLLKAYGGEVQGRKAKPRSRRGRKEPEAKPEPEPLLHSLHALFKSDHLFFSVARVQGEQVVFEGAYVSSWGIVAFKETVARDASIIEAVRKTVLAVSDVGKHRKAHLDRKEHREQAQFQAMRQQLEDSLSQARQELARRSGQWKLLSEERKSTLFAHTAREVAGLQTAVSEALSDSEASISDQRRALEPVRLEWQTLESKVRSLLAWDVAGALKAHHLKNVARLRASADEKLKLVKELLKQKEGNLEKQEARTISRTVSDIAGCLSKSDRLARKDPLEPSARVLLFKALLQESELERQLSLK